MTALAAGQQDKAETASPSTSSSITSPAWSRIALSSWCSRPCRGCRCQHVQSRFVPATSRCTSHIGTGGGHLYENLRVLPLGEDVGQAVADLHREHGRRFSRKLSTPSRASALRPRSSDRPRVDPVGLHRVVGAEQAPQHLPCQGNADRRGVVGDLRGDRPRRRQQIVGRVDAAHQTAGQCLVGAEHPARCSTTRPPG